MNLSLKSSQKAIKVKLMQSAWIPIFIYSLCLLFKGASIALSSVFFLFGIFVTVLLIDLYLKFNTFNVFLTEQYISGPSPFFGFRTKINLSDIKDFSLDIRNSKIHKILLYSKDGKKISIDSEIHPSSKIQILSSRLKNL